jgi:hypothetical protein
MGRTVGIYLCSSPDLFAILCCPRRFFIGDGHDRTESLFSFANKNLFPSGAPTDTAGENRIWVLNTYLTKIHTHTHKEKYSSGHELL